MVTVVVALAGAFVALELVRAAQHVDRSARTRALVRRPGRALPAAIRIPLARALAAADLDVTPEDAALLWAAGTVGVGVVGAALAPTLGIVAALGLGCGAPLALRLAAGRQPAKLVAALPDLLDHVAADLRAGGTVNGALERAAEGSGPLTPDLVALRAKLGLGLDLVEALRQWAAAHPQPGFVEVAGALTVAATTGGRAASALGGLASSLRGRLAVAADVRALSAQSRASAVVVGVAPVAYLVFAAVVDPGSIGILVGTTVGRVCLAVGLALDAVAALWMRRLLQVSP